MRQFHICCGLSSTELTIPRLTCNHWFAGMSLALHFLWGGPQPAWPFWVGPSSAVPVPTKTEGGSSTTGNRRLPQPGSTCKTKQQQQQKSSTKQANKQKKNKQQTNPETRGHLWQSSFPSNHDYIPVPTVWRLPLHLSSNTWNVSHPPSSPYPRLHKQCTCSR